MRSMRELRNKISKLHQELTNDGKGLDTFSQGAILISEEDKVSSKRE